MNPFPLVLTEGDMGWVKKSYFSTFELTKFDDGNEEEITGMA
jgi:hypothetical protein